MWEHIEGGKLGVPPRSMQTLEMGQRKERPQVVCFKDEVKTGEF